MDHGRDALVVLSGLDALRLDKGNGQVAHPGWGRERDAVAAIQFGFGLELVYRDNGAGQDAAHSIPVIDHYQPEPMSKRQNVFGAHVAA